MTAVKPAEQQQHHLQQISLGSSTPDAQPLEVAASCCKDPLVLHWQNKQCANVFP